MNKVEDNEHIILTLTERNHIVSPMLKIHVFIVQQYAVPEKHNVEQYMPLLMRAIHLNLK